MHQDDNRKLASCRWTGERAGQLNITAVEARVFLFLDLHTLCGPRWGILAPPKTWPILLASPGIISSEVSCWLSFTGFFGRAN